MLSTDEALRLAAVRERLFRCIEDELRRDGHHKSYEGSIDVSLSFPNIFERDKAPEWCISWHCYVVDHPEDRHASFAGQTFREALALFEKWAQDVCWPYEMNRFERDMGGCVDDEEEASGEATIYGPTRGHSQEGDG